MNLADVVRSFQAECSRDYVGLWELVRLVKNAFPEDSTDGIKDRCLAIIARSLAEGRIVAGDVMYGASIMPWDLGPEEACQRIRQRWTQLDHEPTLGEVVYFTTPGTPAK